MRERLLFEFWVGWSLLGSVGKDAEVNRERGSPEAIFFTFIDDRIVAKKTILSAFWDSGLCSKGFGTSMCLENSLSTKCLCMYFRIKHPGGNGMSFLKKIGCFGSSQCEESSGGGLGDGVQCLMGTERQAMLKSLL